MTIPVVFATGDAPVTLPTGQIIRVRKGQHWPLEDPVVQASPTLFSQDPRWGMVYTREPDGYDAPIETATAAPGERRNARRTAA
jgi:hypothetical protein